MSKQAAAGDERGSRARVRADSTNTAPAPARPPSRHHLVIAAARNGGAPAGAEASVEGVHPGEADGSAPAPLRGTPWYADARRRGQPYPRQAVDQPPYTYGGSLPDQGRQTRPLPGPVGAPRSGLRQQPGGLTSKTVERVSTLKEDDVAGYQGAPAPGGSPPEHHNPTYTPPLLGRFPPSHHGGTPIRLPGKSPTALPSERKKKRPVAFCFTACCILFWLLVIVVGVAVLVVYLLYHPKPPRLRVETATLNAGYIDELPRRRLALNSDLSILAAISNPNTKIDIVMRYMELDLYFEGNLIGTTAVWPTPLHEGPGGFVLRDVHIVVSEVVLSREDAITWQNATAKGGPVTLHLAGRFHAQLNFGRWLPFRYWIYPRCTLWFDPPPVGSLLRVRCY